MLGTKMLNFGQIFKNCSIEFTKMLLSKVILAKTGSSPLFTRVFFSRKIKFEQKNIKSPANVPQILLSRIACCSLSLVKLGRHLAHMHSNFVIPKQ